MLYVAVHEVLLQAEAGKKLSEEAIITLQAASFKADQVRDLRKLVYADSPNDREERVAAPVKAVDDTNVGHKQPEPVEIIAHENPAPAEPEETPEPSEPVDEQGDEAPPLAQPAIESIKAQAAGLGFFKRLAASVGA